MTLLSAFSANCKERLSFQLSVTSFSSCSVWTQVPRAKGKMRPLLNGFLYACNMAPKEVGGIQSVDIFICMLLNVAPAVCAIASYKKSSSSFVVDRLTKCPLRDQPL